MDNFPQQADFFSSPQSGKFLYAEVIIPLALPKNYTWSVPDQFQAIVKTGCRVEVELRNKKYAGIVKKLHYKKPEAFEPKPILNVLDTEPVIYPAQLKLWEWISDYYLCSEGEVMAAALPAHFKLSSETILLFNEEYGEDFSNLDHDEYLVAEALLIKKELKLSEVQQVLDSTHVYPVIKKLIDKKVCLVWEALKETYTPKKETYVLLNPQFDDEDNLSRLLNEDKKLQRAEKQMELLLAYLHLQKTEGEVTKTELLKKSNASDAQLKGLAEKNILILQKRNVDRLRYLPKNINIDFELSPAQKKAFEQIDELFKTKQVCLLHGVTSSGKTQVYIKQIEQCIKNGKQVLYLLPEIALTSQIIRRLQKHFGGYIGIYHSKFSQNERLEIWNKIRNGELKIVLGARSCLFLPFENLGLIITDEEHDASYKQQEPAPRYNARDAAIFYASFFKAKVLLGSATPSVESFYNASTGKYGLVELMERFGNAKLPSIEIVDTKKIINKEKNKIIISPELHAAIEHSLANNKQVILFQNRRGYSPYQVCEICGWIPQCDNCDVSLTYHKLTNKLHCHYCGTVYPPVNTCAACGNHRFVKRNFGTEKIEEHLEEIFPKAKIARMDIDSVRGKTAHDNLIHLFEQHRIDILVGTQMVVKGLDFENVNLVGITDADSILSFADFRVNERAFQLMEQVSGRAGRKDGDGKVLIQVANTKHPVLGYVKEHNYQLFFQHEIEVRKQFFYPPFSRIILMTFKHKNKDVVEDAANVFANNLKNEFGKYIVGPAEPLVGRIRNQYLMELMFKLPKDGNLMHLVKNGIRQQTAILHNTRKFASVVIIADSDAV
ncbi:MAG: primosomal protein N' [Bacteroidetes bacterium]|nr:primosomal protein N' [Bacteroidota bacterium]